MTKKFKILFAIFLIGGSVILWHASKFYYEQKRYEVAIDTKQGQGAACLDIKIGEDFISVLKKMERFYPLISASDFSSSSIELRFGSEAKGMSVVGMSVAIVFNKDYKVAYKSCGSKWEPEVPEFPAVFHE